MNSYKSSGNAFTLHSILLILVLLFFSACGMRQVHMRALKPALITVPSDVRTLLLVNRSNPESRSQEVIGAILSADLPGDRKAAVQEALNGLQHQLETTSRYTVIRANEEFFGSNISTAFPEALPWAQVEELCEKYDADAVVALEIFSTKFLVTEGKRMVKKVINEKEVQVPEFYATGVATAHMGFRFYDPALKSVVDEKIFTQNGNWEAGGSNPMDALGVLINKSEAQKKVSYDAGYGYGQRISPTPITITRPFYNRPKNNIPISKGTRQADSNQWFEALDTWREGAETAQKTKIASRLAYNTAIGYEVIGDLEKAIEWANKCYVDYGNKKGREYSQALRYRLNEERRLSEQME